MPALALIGLKLMGFGRAAVAWLSHRSLAELALIALAVFVVVQRFEIADARHDRDSYKTQRDYYKGEIDKADAEARKASERANQISKELKARTDEENRRIAGDADSLRVSGPGKATCRPVTGPSGQPKAGSGKPDAAGSEMPPADGAAVPWGWLVKRAEQADLNRAEVLAWREWYDRIAKEWPK